MSEDKDLKNETEELDEKGRNRRNMLKIAGLAGAALGVAGAAGAGLAAGKDKDSYTGWERFHYGEGQFFNREPFRCDQPTYEKVGEATRTPKMNVLFTRLGLMGRAMRAEDGWKPGDNAGKLPEPLRSYYEENPEKLETFVETMAAGRVQRENWKLFKDRYRIADAWSAAHGASMYLPREPDAEPEEFDFRGVDQADKLEFKSPKHASELIKKIAHSFGATLVGITRLKSEWVYADNLRGAEDKGEYEVPGHWTYAIITASPMEWDSMYANPTYGTSFDAYSRERVICSKLTDFIRKIGYPARAHVPGYSYDVMAPPIAVDAGLGEQGRMGMVITPELGANARLSVVTTNIPMEPDKPIDVGIARFCEKCQICADQCPSGAIPKTRKPETVVKGYKRWQPNDAKCFQMWNTVASSSPRGCRICLGVCPYTRKNNWVHTIAREMDPRDPTGLVADGLLAMQKGLFEYPEAEDYLPPPSGKNATYHDGPEWMLTEKWCKVKNSPKGEK
jgi:epoxyqueuosine reductase